MKKLIRWRYVSILLVATFAVAAPRYMGVFGMIVGQDLTQIWPGFRLTEIWSGLAMGALEALVLEYIFYRLRRIKMWSTYWWASVTIGGVILITFPPITAPYMMALMNGASLPDVLNGRVEASFVFWAWTFLVAALIPLIVTAIGIVREDDESLAQAGVGADWIPLAVQADVFLNQWHADLSTQNEPTPEEFVHYFEQRSGRRVDLVQADQFILDWRSKNGRKGARPSTPSLPLPESGQNGAGNS